MADRGREKRHGFGIARFEERNYARLDLPMEYYPTKPKIEGTREKGNATEEGMIIYLRKDFDAGQLLKLKLFLSSGPSLDAIEMLSKVVWTEKLENEEYRCGMKFMDISQEDMSKLSSFLKDLSDLSPLRLSNTLVC